jgi:hypothetical protein
MPRLTKAQAKEVAQMQPHALNVAIPFQTVEVMCTNHWDVDEIVVRVDGGEPKMYRVQSEMGRNPEGAERLYWSDGKRRYYLDECVRYDTPWLSRPVEAVSHA